MVNYEACVRCIRRRVQCSTDEAWEGLNTAYLSLDTTLPERAQCWWLIHIGTFLVKDSIRSQYIGNSGVRRFEASDFLDFVAQPSGENEWDFLNAFPEGLTREFAQLLGEGKAKLTEHSARHWLRTHKNINDRTTGRKIINDIRVYSKRI